MEQFYDALTAGRFYRPQCWAVGVAARPVRVSQVSDGDWLRSGTVVVSNSFFRTPERDREWHGLLPGAV
jgi:hypothetical protein